MHIDNSKIAEKLMQKILVGSILDAIRVRFDTGFTLLFDSINLPNFTGEIFLQLGQNWLLIDSERNITPKEASFNKNTNQNPDDQIVQLHHLRNKVIENVKVNDNGSILSIFFNRTTVLLVSGNDLLYESWEFGTVDFSSDIDIKVVTAPGGSISVWYPSSFQV